MFRNLSNESQRADLEKTLLLPSSIHAYLLAAVAPLPTFAAAPTDILAVQRGHSIDETAVLMEYHKRKPIRKAIHS